MIFLRFQVNSVMLFVFLFQYTNIIFYFTKKTKYYITAVIYFYSATPPS
jgi:hypothetical protein